MPKSRNFKYDIFLSHSAKDKPAVRELAKRLKGDGLRVWFDEWEILPGDSIVKKIEDGLEASRVLVLCMSKHAFASEWAMLESGTFRFRDPINKERRFIPLRLDGAEVKDSLKQFVYVDWRRKSEEQYVRLRNTCIPSVVHLLEESKTDVTADFESRIVFTHTDGIYAVAVSPDGKWAIADTVKSRLKKISLTRPLSESKKIVVSDSEREAESAMMIRAVAVSPDGKIAVTCSSSYWVEIWDLRKMKRIRRLIGNRRPACCLAISHDGQRVISGSYDGSIRIWKTSSGKRGAKSIYGHSRSVKAVALTPDGESILSSSEDKTIQIWNIASGENNGTLEGHTDGVTALAITQDGRTVVSGSHDKTIRLWDISTRNCIGTLEGHTARVFSVAVTPDSKRVISASFDKTIRVWDSKSGRCLTVLRGHKNSVRSVAITPDGGQVISGSIDGTVRLWHLPPYSPQPADESCFQYTNAKVLLVGDSGAGKTGLALRLTQDKFEATISTDGVWAAQLRMPKSNATETLGREVWLWDFAGQADYRMIHQLYVDANALAVFVFNPQSENPFEGLGQWDRDLQRSVNKPLKKLLVAGRCDRGGLMISRASVERFCKERGFAAYIETSALTGGGCNELRDAIVQHISWRDIPWTVAPRIFGELRGEILKLKAEKQTVLLRMAELKQQLEMRLPPQSFTIDFLRASVSLLSGYGAVMQLRFGDFVLLQPERLNAYAFAVIRSVRGNIEEIGCIAEEDVLAGRLDYQDMKRLTFEEERCLLETLHQEFVDRGLCLREPTEEGNFLVFPSYFRRERPELAGHPAILVSYIFNGPFDEIYATLVVRLYHTLAFDKDQLWRYAADFKTQAGKRLGLKMTKKSEGTGEIVIYFEPGVPADVQVTFIRYVHEHLGRKAKDIVRRRFYVCSHCDTPIESRLAVEKRISEGKKDIICGACEKRIPLWDLIEEKFASEKLQQRVRDLEEKADIAIDNESRELILVGHTFAIAGEAGQIYRQYTNSDHGIDGEIEFKDAEGKASGKRLYLQLKSGDSYLYHRKNDGAEIFEIKKARQAQYWQQQAYPVMLVIRTSDGVIRWMNISEYLQRESRSGSEVKRVIFSGEPLTTLSVREMRDRYIRLTP